MAWSHTDYATAFCTITVWWQLTLGEQSRCLIQISFHESVCIHITEKQIEPLLGDDNIFLVSWSSVALIQSQKTFSRATQATSNRTTAKPLLPLLEVRQGGSQAKEEVKGKKTRWPYSSQGYSSFLDNYRSAPFILKTQGQRYCWKLCLTLRPPPSPFFEVFSLWAAVTETPMCLRDIKEG